MTPTERAKFIYTECGSGFSERKLLPMIAARVAEHGWQECFAARFDLAIKRGGISEIEAKLRAWYETREEKMLTPEARRELYGAELWELEFEMMQADNLIAAQEAGEELGLHEDLAAGQSCPSCEFIREEN